METISAEVWPLFAQVRVWLLTSTKSFIKESNCSSAICQRLKHLYLFEICQVGGTKSEKDSSCKSISRFCPCFSEVLAIQILACYY